MRMSTKVRESWPSVKKKKEGQLPSLIRKNRRAPLVPSLGCLLQRAMILDMSSNEERSDCYCIQFFLLKKKC